MHKSAPWLISDPWFTYKSAKCKCVCRGEVRLPRKGTFAEEECVCREGVMLLPRREPVLNRSALRGLARLMNSHGRTCMPWMILSALGYSMQTHMVPIPLEWVPQRGECCFRNWSSKWTIVNIPRITTGPRFLADGSSPASCITSHHNSIHPNLSQSAFAEEKCVCRGTERLPRNGAFAEKSVTYK